MIILDAEEYQVPKLAVPLPIHPVVRRPSTPTPSLPDYETSQEEEEHRLTRWKRRPGSRRMKWTIYGLIVYFVVTVAVGIPLIVLKTRSDEQSYKNPSKLFPSPSSSGMNNGGGFNLGEMPICVSDASVCDAWDVMDTEDGGLLHAHLEYYVPIANTMFIQSNVSSFSSKTGSITGSLDVGVSTDPKDTAASVKVLMSYTGTDLREQTNVCLMNLAGADGLYIYVPQNLTSPDRLDFNITLLFPKSNKTSSLYVPNFLTSLPYFPQHVHSVSPRVTFGNVALEGLRSNITIDNMIAEAILIKSPLANVTGIINGSDSESDPS